MLRSNSAGDVPVSLKSLAAGVGQADPRGLACLACPASEGRNGAPSYALRLPPEFPAVAVGHSACVRSRCCVSGIVSPAAHLRAHSRDPLRPASSTVGVFHVERTCDGRNGVRLARSDGQSPRSTSLAFGVVHSPPDDEDALSDVRRSNVGSSNSEPDRIIPERGKVSENGCDCGLCDGDASDANGRASTGDVLPHRDEGPKLANDARLFGPQTAALTFEASALPCERQVLAGATAAEDVAARGVVGADGSHVVEAKGRRPVMGEDAAAPLVGLALKHRVDIETPVLQGALKTELEPAYPTEQ